MDALHKIHRKTVFGGQPKAEDMHVRFGVNRPCARCGTVGVIRFQVFMPYEEFMEQHYDKCVAFVAQFGRPPPNIDTEFGKFIKVRDFGACRNCQAESEKQAARLPDHYLVWIDYGPKARRVVTSG